MVLSVFSCQGTGAERRVGDASPVSAGIVPGSDRSMVNPPQMAVKLAFMAGVEIETGELAQFSDVKIPDHASGVYFRMVGFYNQGEEFFSFPEETGKRTVECPMGFENGFTCREFSRAQEFSRGNAVEEHPGEHHG